MFKRCLLSALYVLLTSSIAGAAPVYYTFEGTITDFNSATERMSADDFNIIVDQTSVRYIFEIDFDRDTRTRTTSDGTWHYFYNDLLSGEMIVDGGSETINGFNLYHNSIGNSGHLSGGSRVDIIAHDRYTEDWTVQDWQIGQTIGFSDSGYFGSELGAVYAFGDVELTAISTENPIDPVPVPATLLLFGSGIISVLTTRTLKRKKS